MNIACIAWGSLLWKPQGLKLASGWHPGGPPMPLEFARQSDDSPELALVLCERARPMPTYWAYLATDNLSDARAMLCAREKITPARPEWIGSVPALEGQLEHPGVAAWLRARRIDAAIWTAIPPKFNGQNGRVPTADEVVAWLDSCTGEQREAAEDYIRRTPAHIDTQYRRIIAARLGWRALREAHITQMR